MEEKLNIEKIIENEEFLVKLLNTKTDEEIKRVFKEVGLQIKEEKIPELKADINNLLKQYAKVMKENKELGEAKETNVSDKELNEISGGSDDSGFLMETACLGSQIGMIIGAAHTMTSGVRDYKSGKWKGKSKAKVALSLAGRSLKDSIIGCVSGSVTGLAAGFGITTLLEKKLT